MSQRLLDQLVPLCREAFAKFPEITWELVPFVLPNPGANSELATFVALYAEMPGVVLNTTLRTTSVINNSGHTQETIDTVARTINETMLTGRTQQLASMTEEQMKAAQNGTPSPASGLIIP